MTTWTRTGWRYAAGPAALVILLCLWGIPSAPAQADDDIPSGLVAFFNSTQCPPGWEVATYAQGRLIVAVTQPEQGGQTVGKPLRDQEDRRHTHGYANRVSFDYEKITGGGCCNNQGAKAGVNYYVKKDKRKAVYKGNRAVQFIPTDAATSQLPFAQYLACEKQ
jgi:hypothetical protein